METGDEIFERGAFMPIGIMGGVMPIGMLGQ